MNFWKAKKVVATFAVSTVIAITGITLAGCSNSENDSAGVENNGTVNDVQNSETGDKVILVGDNTLQNDIIKNLFAEGSFLLDQRENIPEKNDETNSNIGSENTNNETNDGAEPSIPNLGFLTSQGDAGATAAPTAGADEVTPAVTGTETDVVTNEDNTEELGVVETMLLAEQYAINRNKYLELLGRLEEEEPKEEEIQFLSVYTQGTDDDSVANIQDRLMELGFMEYAEPTKHYGPATMEAVKLFQRQNDLKQDGIIGEQTIGLLFTPEAKSYLLKKDMDGNDIKQVQYRLYELGYLATQDLVNGHFGDETEKAVKALQAANGLSVDGKIGVMTNELLYSEDVKANLISLGDKSDIVLECQKRLKELGYLTTTPDGFYGKDTQAAVKMFQSKNDCIVDGYLGPSTRAVLISSSAKANGLVLGDEGDTVKRVQELLIKYGYMTGSATGYFGDVTEAAVKNFQKNNGLSVDGNVGQKTMSVLTGTSVVKAGGNGGTTGGGSTGGKTDGGKTDGGKTDGGKTDGGSDNGGSVVVTGTSADALIQVAKSKLGCPYIYGSKGPNSFDCSGYVYWCLKQIGVNQSYLTSYQWRTVGKYKKVNSIGDLKKGDIVVVYGHVGIAAGNGMVYDASSSSGEIVYRELGDWWKRNFICGWRIFG